MTTTTTRPIDITDPDLWETHEIRDGDVKVEVPLRDALNYLKLTVTEDYDRESVIYTVARGLIPLLVKAALLEEIE